MELRRLVRAPHPSTRGSFFLLTLFALTGVLTMAMAGLTRSATDLLAANRLVGTTQAFHLAESGIDCAMSYMRNGDTPKLVPFVCSTPSSSSALQRITVSLTQGSNPNEFEVRSTGSLQHNQTSPPTAQSRLVSVLRVTGGPSSPFQQALYGTMAGIPPNNPGVRLEMGALANSYDSNLGDYDSFSNVGSRALMHTSSGSVDAVRVSGGSTLNGDTVTTNPTPPNFGVDAWTGTHNGTKSNGPSESFPSAPVPSPPAGCTYLNNVVVSTGNRIFNDPRYCIDSLTIMNGRTASFPNLERLYVYNDLNDNDDTTGSPGNVYVSGGGQLQVGQGVLEVTGILSVRNSGSRVEATSDRIDIYARWLDVADSASMKGVGKLPSNLRIFYASPTPGASGEIMSISWSEVYGVIYAPDVFVRVDGPSSSSALYGAAIGNQPTIQTAQLHFDERAKDALFWPAWIDPDAPPKTVELLAEYAD